MNVGADIDFREHLVVELVRRCSENPRYSLRAFARHLRVEHATLSQMLRGKRAVSATTIRKLGARLGLDTQTVEHFVAVTQPTAASAAIEWIDRAILEHLLDEAFVPDVRSIARTLDCTTDEVQVSLHRLMRLGLVKTDGARWVRSRGE